MRGLGQDVWTPRAGGGALSHVLKVFLIDRRGSVREIYSTSFLHTQVLLNDIKTLLLEDGDQPGSRRANQRATPGAARQPLPIAAYATTQAVVLEAPPATSSAAPKITGPSIPPPNPASE